MAENKEKKPELEKINMEKIRGRIIIIDPEKSELAKKLGLNKKGDYFKKIK
ncbi:MAG: DNA-directed RNA polymerase subunit E'' [Candidatus Pacearchaeota archaeon]